MVSLSSAEFAQRVVMVRLLLDLTDYRVQDTSLFLPELLKPCAKL